MKKIVKGLLAGGLVASSLVVPGCQKGANGGAASGAAAEAAAVPAADAVKVEFYVMSQCPYGKQVEDGIYPVLKKLGNAVDFKLNFIGSDNGGNLTSMHGDAEVKGDIVQLCAAKYNAAKYMDMVNCMNQNIRGIPGNWESCASSNGLDVAKIKTCFEGEEGKNLLATSFKKSNEVGARGSPTMKIAGKDYNGGRSEDAFLRAICGNGAKSAACDSLPPPVEVKMTVLSDTRCKQCGMQVARMQGYFQSMMPGLKVTAVDYGTEDGKKVFADNQIKALPALVFDANVEKVDEMRRFMMRAKKVGDNRIMEMGNFDPTAEICDNGIDDTNNGKVDCEDDTCKNTLTCRKEEKGKLELFIMSQCPYGVRALNSVKEVLDTIPADKIDFHVNYIADEVGECKFNSLHGQGEVDENIRELCAIKLYGKDNKYMNYILCRNKNIRDANWKACATAETGIDAAAMEKCIADEGCKLHSENIKNAKQLEIGASPTWIANNKYKFSGISADDIKANWCKYNEGVAGCDKQLSKDAAVQGSCN